MSLSSISFVFDEAAKNVRRNGLMSLAALTTVAISMAVLGGALFTLYRLHQFAEAQPRQFEVQVYLRTAVRGRETLKVKRRIQELPGVASITLFPAEKALAELEQRDKETGGGLTDALEGANPLPDRLDLHMTDPKLTARVTAQLSDKKRFPQVDTVRDARDTLEMLFSLQRVVRNVGAIAALLLFLATAFVIQNTIRLTVFARRREIRIMQLVGATPSFIRMPMMLEGIFYGVAGSLLASGVVVFVVYQVSKYAGRYVSPLTQNMPAPVGYDVIVGVLVFLGALIGWMGSVLSIRDNRTGCDYTGALLTEPLTIPCLAAPEPAGQYRGSRKELQCVFPVSLPVCSLRPVSPFSPAQTPDLTTAGTRPRRTPRSSGNSYTMCASRSTNSASP